MTKRNVVPPWLAGVAVTAALFLAGGCGAPTVNLFPDSSDPLREFTIDGTGREKVLVIHIRGSISDSPKRGLFQQRMSIVQEVVSRLRKAERDRSVRAVVLKIDSPGGTVTASDVLYHEIAGFKERTGAAVVAALMKTATSGAYYISLPADYIMAHPTTVTGSTGVIFLRPKVEGLIKKIGVGVEIDKSGRLKDLGSPLRQDTDEEKQILQGMIDEFGRRFIDLVVRHRRLDEEARAEISTARIYLTREARELGLVDGTGYLSDALAQSRQLAGLPENARVVVYRRREQADDTLYNGAAYGPAAGGPPVLALGLPAVISSLDAGFYYLWLPGVVLE